MKKDKDVQEKLDREKQEKLDRMQELNDIKAILSTPHGLRFFKRFMRDGYIFQTTFTGNSNGYFLEGHRNFALKYFKDICEAEPEKVPLIMIEKEEK